MPCNHAVRLLLASALRPTTTLVEAKEMKGSTLQEDHKSQVTNVGETAPLKTGPAFLFDLDGTLVDSVYQHVLAWQEALEKMGIELAVWRIHRRIGMSGGLLVNALLREIGRRVTKAEAERLARLHAEAYVRLAPQVRALPGASELLAFLSDAGLPWAIATSGLGISIHESVVVGDSVWDLLAARRARALGVGLLSGGYGQDELERAGAYRVYQDPADLLRHLDEVGFRTAE